MSVLSKEDVNILYEFGIALTLTVRATNGSNDAYHLLNQAVERLGNMLSYLPEEENN